MTLGYSPRYQFNAWRSADSDALVGLVDEVMKQALRAESILSPRTRARRPHDAETFRLTVEAVVCDALYRHAVNGSPVSIPRNKRTLARKSRYGSRVLGKQLPKILDLLSSRELSFITQDVGQYIGQQPTLISPGPRLLTRATALGLTSVDFGRREGEELVVLRSPRDAEGLNDLAEYIDTAETRAYRDEVRKINAYLAAADIDYSGPATYDDKDRFLVRRFTRSSFESGGRLWGGFWQNMSKAHRLSHITINGEGVAALDYSAMVVRTVYALIGETPPDGDAYTLGVALPRGTAKTLTAACLFSEKPLRGWPGDTASDTNGVALREALRAVAARHPALVPHFYSGIAHRAMFMESEILIDVLLRLIGEDVPALPVHDAVIIPESALSMTDAAMHEVFFAHTKLPAIVKREEIIATP